jgi:hypothetical protein
MSVCREGEATTSAVHRGVQRDAVELVRTTGRPIADIAAELEIYDSTLGAWVRRAVIDRGEQDGLISDGRPGCWRWRPRTRGCDGSCLRCSWGVDLGVLGLGGQAREGFYGYQAATGRPGRRDPRHPRRLRRVYGAPRVDRGAVPPRLAGEPQAGRAAQGRPRPRQLPAQTSAQPHQARCQHPTCAGPARPTATVRPRPAQPRLVQRHHLHPHPGRHLTLVAVKRLQAGWSRTPGPRHRAHRSGGSGGACRGAG